MSSLNERRENPTEPYSPTKKDREGVLDPDMDEEALPREPHHSHLFHHDHNPGEEDEDVEEVNVGVMSTEKLEPISEVYRFSLMALGCFGCICTAFSYAYNLISADLQKLLDMGQIDLVNINIVGQIFNYFTLPYSFLFDYLGPCLVAILAGFYFFLGALLLGLTFQQYITPTVVRLCVFNAIMNSGCMLYDMTGNITVSGYFPTLRGLTIALLKSYVGLGSSIVGAIQLGFFGTNMAGFMYFLAAYAAVAGGLLAIFMKLAPYHLTGYQESHLPAEEKARRLATKSQYLRQRPPMWRFGIGYGILISLIIFLTTESACVNYMGLGRNYKIAFAVVTIVLTLAIMCIFVPDCGCTKPQITDMSDNASEESDLSIEEPNMELKQVQGIDGPSEDSGNQVQDVGLKNAPDTEQSAKAKKTKAKKHVETEIDYIAPQYQTSFLRNLLTLRLWFIVWTLFCLTGAEFVLISNSSYVYGSIYGAPTPTDMRNMLTVLNGAGSAVGRLIMAAFEHLTQNRPPEKRIPLTWAPMIPICIAILCLIFFLTLPARALPLPYVLIAIANGAQAAQTVLVPRTIYAKDPAKHYNFCFLACVFSNIIIVRFLYAEWYNRQAVKHGDTGGYCFGKDCMLMPLCVMLGLVVSAALTTLYVHFRYRAFCNKVLAERRRLRDADDNEDEEEYHIASHDRARSDSDSHSETGKKVEPTA